MKQARLPSAGPIDSNARSRGGLGRDAGPACDPAALQHVNDAMFREVLEEIERVFERRTKWAPAKTYSYSGNIDLVESYSEMPCSEFA